MHSVTTCEGRILTAADTGLLPDGGGLMLGRRDDLDVDLVWHNLSTRDQDQGALERGYLISRLEAVHDSGALVGYLSVGLVTPAWAAACFDDPLAWAEENTGHSFGFHMGTYDTSGKLWARAFNAANVSPPSNPPKRCSWSWSAEDAPQDPAVVAADMEFVRDHYRAQMGEWLAARVVPWVDFSRVLDGDALAYAGVDPALSMLGRGLGRDLYLAGARHLGSMGMRLRGSTAQSPSAQALWDRLVADPAVPTVREGKVWALDFTDGPEELRHHKTVDIMDA